MLLILFWNELWYFYHLTLVRMAIIKKSGDNRCWRGCGEIGTLLHCWWECKLVQPLWKTVWWFLKDLEMEIPFDPAIPLLSIYPKDYKSWHMHMNVHCSTVYNSKDLEPAQMPINDRLDRENMAHIHHGILCRHQNRWVWIRCRDMNEPGHHHSQQTDTRMENQTLHVLTHKWMLNNENTWTQGGEHHTLGETRGGTLRGRELGRDTMGRNARYRWLGWRQQITLPYMYLCNNSACSAHVPQNLKCNKIYFKIMQIHGN